MNFGEFVIAIIVIIGLYDIAQNYIERKYK